MSDSASPRRTDTRQLILDSAMHEFSTSGYHKATVDGIAAGAGLSKGAVYWHFNSKKDLFLAIIRRELNRFMEYLQAVTREGGGLTLEERLERFIVAALAYDYDNPEHPLLMRHFSTLRDSEMQQDLQSIARDMYLRGREIVEPLFQDGVSRGVLDPDLAEAATPVLLTLLAGLKTGPDISSEAVPPEKIASDIARVFMEGVVKRGTG